MDTPKPYSPFYRWLLLCLAVLLAHLGLLQSMPLTLSAGRSVADSTMTFTTRAITPDPDPLPAPLTPTTVIRDKAAQPRQTVAKATPAATDITTTDNHTPASSFDGASDPLAAAPATAPASSPEPTAAAEQPEQIAPPRPPPDLPYRFQAASLSGSARLLYKVQGNRFPFNLNGELQWQNQGQHYQARLSYSAFGQGRWQSSSGQITDAGLAPERFADKYRSELAAHFNREQGKVTFSANTPDAPLLAGAQDRLSVLLQLGALVASEPERFGPGTTLTVQTVGPREADLWLFTFEGRESLTLPGGILEGIKLVRNPRKPYDQRVEIWLAPALGYLPARIRITETNGDAMDQQWLSTEPVSVPP